MSPETTQKEADDERRAKAIALLQEWAAEDEALTDEDLKANAAILRAIDENRPYRKLFENVGE